MSLMRTLPAILVAVLLAASPVEASAQSMDVMTVQGLAHDASGESLAVWVEAGLLVQDTTGAFTFMCTAGWEDAGAEARWLVQTAPGRPLIAGSQGPYMALESGCTWARISGAADSANITGMHATEEGGGVVVFAMTRDFGPDEVARTEDGGFTSASTGGFSQLDTRLTGLVGDGDVLVMSGLGITSGASSMWLSEDAGDSFVVLELPGYEGGALVGLGGRTLWLMVDTQLVALDLDTGAALDSIPVAEAVESYAVEPTGALWWSTSGGTVSRAEPASGERADYDLAGTSILFSDGAAWIGLRAQLPGDPLVVRMEPGASNWEVMVSRPDSWLYPESCETLQTQTCAEDATRLMPPEPDETDPEPAVASSDDDGCAGGGSGPESYIFLFAWIALASRAAWTRNPGHPASP